MEKEVKLQEERRIILDVFARLYWGRYPKRGEWNNVNVGSSREISYEKGYELPKRVRILLSFSIFNHIGIIALWLFGALSQADPDRKLIYSRR